MYMKNGLLQQAAEYVRKHHRKGKRRIASAALAAAVVFVTVSSTTLPAATLESEQSGQTEQGSPQEVSDGIQRKLICTPERLQLHKHTDACLDENGAYVCGYADFVVHTHTEDCYDEKGELCCPLPEIEAHTHTDSCYTAAESAHAYTEDCYTSGQGDPACGLSGEPEEPELTCGKDEILLHEHGQDCYDENGALICGKTQVLEHVHSEECFQSIVETSDTYPVDNASEEGTKSVENGENTQTNQIPEAQVTGQSSGTQEIEQTYEDQEQIPEVQNPDQNPETPDAELAEGGIVSLNDTFQYTDDTIFVVLHVSGDAAVRAESEDAAEADTETAETSSDVVETDTAATETISPAAETASDITEVPSETAEDVTLDVTTLSEGQPDYEAVQEYAEGQGDGDNIVGISALEFAFSYQGHPLDVSGCTLTAEITPTEKVQDAADQMDGSEAGEIVPDAEVGVELTALQTADDGTAQELGSVLVEKDGDQKPALTVTLDAADPQVQVLAQETANPKFTVQYYAWLPRVQYGDNGQLTIINTDNGGTGAGGNLPQNGANGVTSTINLELTATGTAGVYGVTTENELEEVYAAHSYEYVSAPNLTYFNRLYENGNYSLTKVWVLKDGKDAASTDQDDWDVYDIDKVHFTNRPQSAGTSDGVTTLLITDNTVIRLVYDTTSDSYNNAASFYDYDITEDGGTTSDADGDKGINNPSNYTDWQQGEAKLAFGNANTGVSLQDDLWRGNQLNQYNRSGSGYLGGTYGLATGLDSEGHIQYADGVSVPNLFNDGSATGKTSYDNGQYSLNFNRDGDTYTLTSVEGAGESADNLQYFNHPTCGTTTYNHIWTNNFWPLDGANDGKGGVDGLTGNYIDRKEYVSNGVTNLYPLCDDGQYHNQLFGMTYTVNFNLVEDYSGPLEYLFFGDDDMWVFLTDPNGNSRLVCDIGGVHSTVGEYVNLWDYIARTADSETGAQKVSTPGDYTLTFFYTERGLSGSSCYMQFTLPSVSSVTPEQNTSQLKVQKVVTGGTEAQNNTDEFNFTIALTDASDNHLLDDYAYTRYAADGTEILTDLITFDGGTFSLKNGEYIIIRYLPYGTKYTITENGTGDPNASLDGEYTVSGTVNAGGSSASVPFTGVTASGQIQEGQNGEVIYTNTLNPKLPDTGGTGTFTYTFGGIALTAFSSVYLVLRRRRSR